MHGAQHLAGGPAHVLADGAVTTVVLYVQSDEEVRPSASASQSPSIFTWPQPFRRHSQMCAHGEATAEPWSRAGATSDSRHEPLTCVLTEATSLRTPAPCDSGARHRHLLSPGARPRDQRLQMSALSRAMSARHHPIALMFNSRAISTAYTRGGQSANPELGQRGKAEYPACANDRAT
jgi:hypothetical protein